MFKIDEATILPESCYVIGRGWGTGRRDCASWSRFLLGMMKSNSSQGLDSDGGRVTLNAQLDTFQKQCGGNLVFYHIENPFADGKTLA